MARLPILIVVSLLSLSPAIDAQTNGYPRILIQAQDL